MKKWMLLILLFNLFAIALITYFYNIFRESNQVKVIHHVCNISENEKYFLFDYSIELDNQSKNEYQIVIPELSKYLGDVRIHNLTLPISLKPGENIHPIGTFAIYKEGLTNEQTNFIRKNGTKIIVNFVLGERIPHDKIENM